MLREWLQRCDQAGIPVRDVDLAFAEMTVAAWRRRGLRERTVGTYVDTVHAFYRWLTDHNIVAESPFERIKRPRRERRSNLISLTRDEAAAVLAAAQAHSPRAFAVIALFLLNGLRMNDVRTLRATDIEHRDGQMVLHLRHRKFGTQQRIVAARTVAEALTAYVGARRTGYVMQANPRYARRNAPLSKETFERDLSQVCARAGIEEVTAHQLRATFITLALDAGVPLRDVMVAAGHSSRGSTHYYDTLWRSTRTTAPHRLNDYLRE
ncbi:tyrosine-type recombinase/integrase [Brevibacterium gallinarum]|uniref:Site-specific integrase n=1 Tax=Brevibacterium gallinarum TaxID=2762220 RepID=A0ABR8WQQ0_9MICO|nr:site-specific integrase [Brevibacterium gallinarum]MBD8019405.1 site-specific integrase [Brevibacterium gallinarum]